MDHDPRRRGAARSEEHSIDRHGARAVEGEREGPRDLARDTEPPGEGVARSGGEDRQGACGPTVVEPLGRGVHGAVAAEDDEPSGRVSKAVQLLDGDRDHASGEPRAILGEQVERSAERAGAGLRARVVKEDPVVHAKSIPPAENVPARVAEG